MATPSVFAELVETAGVTLSNSTELLPSRHQPGDAGLQMLVVENSLGRAVIALQGAHLMSFQPTGENEMLWVSPKSALATGKPIRGGIPLCLPWFGPGPEGKLLHGFSRIMEWSLVAAEITEDGATRVVLKLSGEASTCDLWPHAFAFRLDVFVGNELRLGLAAKNCSDKEAPFSFAFHTYFAVPDFVAARIGGLEGVTFIDKMNNEVRRTQEGEVAIDAESVYIYQDVPTEQILKTPDRAIRIESPAKCAVIWNCGANAKNVGDIGEGNNAGYLCVERGDLADYALTLLPDEEYETWMTLSY